MIRKYTNKILDMVDDGSVYEKDLIRDLLNWMSEAEVEEFYEHHFSFEPDEDGQPTEAEEWHDFDPDC